MFDPLAFWLVQSGRILTDSRPSSTIIYLDGEITGRGMVVMVLAEVSFELGMVGW